MQGKTGNYILIGMVLGATLGALGGYFFGNIFIEIKFIGTLFLNALKMIVIPLIVASMIVGVTSLGDIRKLGRTSGKTLSYYLATTGFSVLIGIILVNLIQPGVGVPPIGAAEPDFIHGSGGGITIKNMILSFIPDNIFNAAAEGQILPLILFSVVLGGVLTAIGKKGKPVIDFFVGLNMAIMKIVILIIYFAPIGIFALIGGIVAENRDSLQEIAAGLGMYSLTVIIGLLIHAVIILPLILKFFGKRDPFKYFLNMGQALTTAFTTASSAATLPVTMGAVTDKNKVDSKASSFVLPLGATINMDGTALYEAVAAIFIAQIYGIDLSVGAQVIIFFTAVLASIGAAAIPEAGLVMMTLVLSAVGLPLEGIGIILVIDWFLDRCRTTVNVWGDSIGAAVIGETAEIRGYRIGGSKTKPATTGGKKYSKTSKTKPDRPAKGPRTTAKKYGSKTRVTRDSKPRENKRYQRTADIHQKSNVKGSSSDKNGSHKKGASYKSKKPSIKTNGDRPTRSNEPTQMSKKTIEQDLEKIHRQLAKSSKPDGTKKDISEEPESTIKSNIKTDKAKGDFFEDGIPKFNFFDDNKTTKDDSGEEKPFSASEATKNEDIEVKDDAGEKSRHQATPPKMPVISIPSAKEEIQDESNDKDKKKTNATKSAPSDKSDEVEVKSTDTADQKPDENKTSSSDETKTDDKSEQKPVKKTDDKEKSESDTKQDKNQDIGWGRDKKRRPSK